MFLKNINFVNYSKQLQLYLGIDHLTWRRRGWGVMVFCFVQNFFFGQHES